MIPKGYIPPIDGYKVGHGNIYPSVTASEHSVTTKETEVIRQFSEGTIDQITIRADSGNWKEALKAVQTRFPAFEFSMILDIKGIGVNLTGTAEQIIAEAERIENFKFSDFGLRGTL
jgi:hypothetical protein